MATKVVNRQENGNVLVDKGLKNPWKWEWLEKKVDGEPVRRFIRKHERNGKRMLLLTSNLQQNRFFNYQHQCFNLYFLCTQDLFKPNSPIVIVLMEFQSVQKIFSSGHEKS